MVQVHEEAFASHLSLAPGRASNYLRVLRLFQKSSALPSPGSEIGKNTAVPVLPHCFNKGKPSLLFCAILWLASAGRHSGCSLPGLHCQRRCFSSRASVIIHQLELQFFLSNKGRCPSAFFVMCTMCLQLSFLSLPMGKNIIESFFLKPARLCVQSVQRSSRHPIDGCIDYFYSSL